MEPTPFNKPLEQSMDEKFADMTRTQKWTFVAKLMSDCHVRIRFPERAEGMSAPLDEKHRPKPNNRMRRQKTAHRLRIGYAQRSGTQQPREEKAQAAAQAGRAARAGDPARALEEVTLGLNGS